MQIAMMTKLQWFLQVLLHKVCHSVLYLLGTSAYDDDDDNIDDNEYVVSHDNGSDDNDGIGDESVPQTNPNEKIKFRWTKKDIPISDERFSPKVDDTEETLP